VAGSTQSTRMDTVKSLLLHPSELLAYVAFAWSTQKSGRYVHKHATSKAMADGKLAADTHAQCYHFLNLTSRSFAAVVQALDDELRDPICIFYLVLRGMDTVGKFAILRRQKRLFSKMENYIPNFSTGSISYHLINPNIV
jgi:hypothetical protein